VNTMKSQTRDPQLEVPPGGLEFRTEKSREPWSRGESAKAK
jgi:hypothetical protein